MSGKLTVRTLDVLDVSGGDEGIDIVARARSFLHSQVRSMAGALKLVGQGKWLPEDMKAALEATDRRACAPVAPAHGLTFMSVDYPEEMLAEPRETSLRKNRRPAGAYKSQQVVDVVSPHALIDLMHCLADQTKFNHTSGILDKARIGCAAACGQFGLVARH